MGSSHSISKSSTCSSTTIQPILPKAKSVEKFSFFEQRGFSLRRVSSISPDGPPFLPDVKQMLEFLQAYPVAFLATDTNHKVLFCNKNAEELLDISESRLKGLMMFDLFLGWSKVPLESGSGQMTLVAKLCQRRFESKFSMMDDGGTDIYLYLLNEKIDDQAVRILQTVNYTVIEASSIPIIAMDSNCTVKIFNTAAEQVFGYSKAEVAARNINMLMPSHIARVHDKIVFDYVQKGLSGEKAVGRTRNVNGLRRDGTEVPLELTVREIRVSDQYRLFIGVARDRSLLITRSEQSDRSKLASEIFPPMIAQRITDGERFIHDVHDCVSIVFCDIVGFTSMSSMMSSETIVTVVNAVFSAIDRTVLGADHRLEKIKTIGDCYMLVAGLSNSSDDHANSAVEAALKMIEVANQVNNQFTDMLPTDCRLQLRIGINSGEVVAGIAGEIKPCYDVWGSSVNIASRMESTGIPGCIQITQETFNLLNMTNKRRFNLRKGVQLKGVGLVDTFVSLSKIEFL